MKLFNHVGEALRNYLFLRIAVMLSSFLIYLAVMLFARHVLQDASPFFVVLPLIGSAFGWGLPIAIIPIVVCCTLNLIFVQIFSSEILIQLSIGAKIIGTSALLLLGIALAYVKTSTDRLRKAIKEIKTLSGLLPMCAGCKKIRDDDGYWQEVEAYIMNHSESTFSHGLCPECMQKHYPEYFEILDRDKAN